MKSKPGDFCLTLALTSFNYLLLWAIKIAGIEDLIKGEIVVSQYESFPPFSEEKPWRQWKEKLNIWEAAA